MDSIGEVLKQERERRGLTLDATHEATKITVQSIEALEEDRFESFPNKVYARAFLRDYANFLSLDSASLLTAYEEKWGPRVEKEPAPVVETGGSGWRAIGYTMLVMFIVAALAAGGFYAWKTFGPRHSHQASRPSENGATEVATIPKAQQVTPPKPEPAPKPEVAPKPVTPVVPQKAVLEVTAILPVWIGVKTDDKTAFMNVLPKGETKTFEGKKSVFIRAGMAGAVQLKFNGQPQPPLGSMKKPGEKTFTLPAAPPPAPVPTTAPPVPSTNPPAPTGAPR